jgi:hypothetical protein
MSENPTSGAPEQPLSRQDVHHAPQNGGRKILQGMSRLNASPGFIRGENEEKLADRLLKAHQLGAELNFRRALDCHAVLSWKERGEGLYQRYHSRYGAPALATVMLKAFLGGSEAMGEYRKFRQKVASEGLLIEERDRDFFARCIADTQHYVIAEARALHPSPDSRFHSSRIARTADGAVLAPVIADCTCVLPDDMHGAQRVVALPNREKSGRPDRIYDERLFERIEAAHPASIGLIDQLCVDKEFQHLGCVAEARHEALKEVHDRNEGREYSIEHMIGKAFCIQGLRMENGKEFYLHEYTLPSITNMISLLVNEQSSRCPATIYAREYDDAVPVKFAWEGSMMNAWILTDWYHLDHEIEQVQMD